MKGCIVSSSTLHKYGFWSADYYLYKLKEHELLLASRRKAVEAATRLLREAESKSESEKQRVQSMINNGEIIPL